ncbi:hypothetical protein SD80_011630 [Scytonema tolypothrichoides VB-61278]|nr:hypothetical protein SD80_011630 [Scytonema tolypothrichoides VB-61278]
MRKSTGSTSYRQHLCLKARASSSTLGLVDPAQYQMYYVIGKFLSSHSGMLTPVPDSETERLNRFTRLSQCRLESTDQ